MKAPVFIPDISVNLEAEEKDIDFEVKTTQNDTKWGNVLPKGCEQKNHASICGSGMIWR